MRRFSLVLLLVFIVSSIVTELLLGSPKDIIVVTHLPKPYLAVTLIKFGQSGSYLVDVSRTDGGQGKIDGILTKKNGSYKWKFDKESLDNVQKYEELVSNAINFYPDRRRTREIHKKAVYISRYKTEEILDPKCAMHLYLQDINSTRQILSPDLMKVAEELAAEF